MHKGPVGETQQDRTRKLLAVLAVLVIVVLIVVAGATRKEPVPPGESGCKTYAELEKAEEEQAGYPRC